MTVRKLLFAVSLLFFATGPYADAADVLDFVETERQASTDIADTLWRLAELGYLEQTIAVRYKITWLNGNSPSNRVLRIYRPLLLQSTVVAARPSHS